MFIDVSEMLAASIMALMLKAASTSETSVNFYQTKEHHNPKGSHIQSIKMYINYACVSSVLAPLITHTCTRELTDTRKATRNSHEATR
jgi:hypothetical protein